MRDLYADLAWLPAPPPDFRERCRAIADSAEPPGPAIASLATHALDEQMLRRLTTAIGAAVAGGRSLEPLVPFRLGVVGSATMEYALALLPGSAARFGLALECVAGDFGQIAQEALLPESRINRAKPDAVLIALDARGLGLRPGADAEAARASLEQALSFVDGIRAGFRINAGAPCIVQTIVPPPETVFGSFDARFPGSPRRLCAAFNAALAASLEDGDALLDVAALAETIGLANWHSPKQWNVGKLPFDARYLPIYADHVARVAGALRGKSRRVLVLDLDNTLWGGIVGDDGVEGIVLGQGDPTGEAFLDVQRAALALRERGVLLAISSKNDDAIARAPFREHAEMLLREEHVAAFAANWHDKASNLAAIAADLKLGVDSLVLLDDNPAERALVRSALPAVAVPELPADPALYARYLAAAGYFESVAFSNEDRTRADAYEAEARRIEVRRQIPDLDAYLASLDMSIAFAPFDANGRQRIAQLINKSNQYNLTTRRYSELEIAAIEADAAAFTLQVRLADRFGDNGTIAVVILRERAPAQWDVDTWLMSCRVLGRRVEHAVLAELLAQARARGIASIHGTYVPTARNAIAADHYAKLGFTADGESNGTTFWTIDAATQLDPVPMRVELAGFHGSVA